ncbi:uncharacterized protein N7473_001255 [Penicillium subrubescens]|uniref:uncharacterized protein n=1 Tax=Penicillium subrubescens TaxID=1316194 RepID=UPI00254523A0|nr:uncharacterized protein N7473_001255 [Penicillium subrubescens]KAJ5911952.1 hypothetical protein N7473_001255 [Penicillium subrubescens]
MAYPGFHQLHPELEDVGALDIPVFHDTDNSPLYEDPYQGLLRDIVAANDVVALRLYHANPHTWTRVFRKDYMNPHWHPFLVAKVHGCGDALRVLLEIYLSDPVYQMPRYPPLEEYLERWAFSPIHMACATADRGLILWLLSDKQRNGYESPLAMLRDPGNGYGGRTPLICAVGWVAAPWRGCRAEGGFYLLSAG